MNANEYINNRKVHYNLTGLRRDLRMVSKPDYLAAPEGKETNTQETRSVVSKFNGWLSINDSEKLTRKNAPEISKLPLADMQQAQFKPKWMQGAIKSDEVPPMQANVEAFFAENLYKKNAKIHTIGTKRVEHERSVWNQGIYRQNLNTKEQFKNDRGDHLAKSFSGIKPAGTGSNPLYKIKP